MRAVVIVGSIALLASACGGKKDDKAAAKTDASATPSGSAPKPIPEIPPSVAPGGGRFPLDLDKAPCRLLTAEIVAGVTGQPATALQKREMPGKCIYVWEGGRAGVGLLHTNKTPSVRAKSFDREHRNRPAIEDKPAKNYVEVKGVGEKAWLETTRRELPQEGKAPRVSYDNALSVLVSNLSFTVFYQLAGEAKLHQPELETLGKAVVAALPEGS